ncbi:MAG: LysR substrate-binding domain-containing protein [Lautropia sp.]|nr:LysR substrate-binding domain-containing protein [Lautropia sp.]
MPKPLPSLDALHAFEAAARLESFKRAAAELNLTATAISHRIRKLEDDLGCALFTRRVRAVTLTREGQRLLAAVQSGLATIGSAVADIRQPARHVVTLSVTPELATHWLVPRLAAFQRRFPHIDLHVHASYQPVDLAAGAADLAIRYGRGPFPGLHATVLFKERFAPVASPALKAALHADPRQWPLIHMKWHHKALAQDLGSLGTERRAVFHRPAGRSALLGWQPRRAGCPGRARRGAAGAVTAEGTVASGSAGGGGRTGAGRTAVSRLPRPAAQPVTCRAAGQGLPAGMGAQPGGRPPAC